MHVRASACTDALCTLAYAQVVFATIPNHWSLPSADSLSPELNTREALAKSICNNTDLGKIEQAIDVLRSFGYAVCRDILSWYQSVVTILQIQYIASDLMAMMCKSLTFFRELLRQNNASGKLITKAKLQVVINLFVNFIHYFVMIFIMILILNPTRIIRACSLSLKWPLLELTTWHAIVSFWRRFWWRWQW